MRLQDKLAADKPREKLAAKGPAALSDLELLMAIFGSGTAQADVTKIARSSLKLLQRYGTDITHEQLRSVTGLGVAKTTELLAAFELSKRYLLSAHRPIIDSTEAASGLLTAIQDKKQEHFIAITLDGANRLIAKRTITIGTLTSTLVHPREVFADAISDHAAAIIIAHNHPSGSLTPSEADKHITKSLVETGKILGIELLDHLLVTKRQTISILETL